MSKDTYQLQPIYAGMPYNDFLEAVKRNLSVLLNAYITGANVVQFTGSPGVGGSAGKRGASFLHITDDDLIAACGTAGVTLPDGITADNVLESTDNTIAAISAIMLVDNAIIALFKGNEIIHDTNDIVLYDTFMCSNGAIAYVTYTVNDTTGRRTYAVYDTSVVTPDVSIDTKAIADEVYELVKETMIGQNFASNESVTVPFTYMNMQYNAVLPDYIDNAEQIGTATRRLVYLAVNIAESMAETVEHAVVVSGTNIETKELYDALSYMLSSQITSQAGTDAKRTMPNGSQQPAHIIIQSESGVTPIAEDSANGMDAKLLLPDKKFGITIVDMDSLHRSIDGSAIDNNGAQFGAFASITKSQSGLWVMSNSDAGDSYGKIYLSKRLYQVAVTGLHKIVANAHYIHVVNNTIERLGYNTENGPMLNSKHWRFIGGDFIQEIVGKCNLTYKNATVCSFESSLMNNYGDSVANNYSSVVTESFEQDVDRQYDAAVNETYNSSVDVSRQGDYTESQVGDKTIVHAGNKLVSHTGEETVQVTGDVTHDLASAFGNVYRFKVGVADKDRPVLRAIDLGVVANDETSMKIEMLCNSTVHAVYNKLTLNAYYADNAETHANATTTSVQYYNLVRSVNNTSADTFGKADTAATTLHSRTYYGSVVAYYKNASNEDVMMTNFSLPAKTYKVAADTIVRTDSYKEYNLSGLNKVTVMSESPYLKYYGIMYVAGDGVQKSLQMPITYAQDGSPIFNTAIPYMNDTGALAYASTSNNNTDELIGNNDGDKAVLRLPNNFTAHEPGNDYADIADVTPVANDNVTTAFKKLAGYCKNVTAYARLTSDYDDAIADYATSYFDNSGGPGVGDSVEVAFAKIMGILNDCAEFTSQRIRGYKRSGYDYSVDFNLSSNPSLRLKDSYATANLYTDELRFDDNNNDVYAQLTSDKLRLSDSSGSYKYMELYSDGLELYNYDAQNLSTINIGKNTSLLQGLTAAGLRLYTRFAWTDYVMKVYDSFVVTGNSSSDGTTSLSLPVGTSSIDGQFVIICRAGSGGANINANGACIFLDGSLNKTSIGAGGQGTVTLLIYSHGTTWNKDGYNTGDVTGTWFATRL